MAKKSYKFKNCLFGAISLVKNSDKEKDVYSGHGITFDSAWSFDNESRANFLALGEVPPFGINGGFGSAEKKFSINFSKENTKFCLSLNYNADNSYFFVNEKEIFKSKANNKNVSFPT